MDLLDTLLGHDQAASEELLSIARGLGESSLDQEVDIGHRTLRATFDHMIWNIEAWSDQLVGHPVRGRPGQGETTGAQLSRRLRAAYRGFADAARSIRDRGAWDELWTDRSCSPPVQRSYSATVGHVITHSMHHRAQILFMLRLLGVSRLPEGDVLGWARGLAE